MVTTSELWRDPAVWDQVAGVLPTLAPSGGDVRCWSAGCSHGAEVYTLAALCRELCPRARVQIHGTDINPGMIDAARAGEFTAWRARKAPEGLLRRHFEPIGRGGWRAGAELRRMVTFEVGDLFTAPVDRDHYRLALCRNVAIWLGQSECESLYERIQHALAPGGYLIIGNFDQIPSGLRRVAHCIYRKAPVF